MLSRRGKGGKRGLPGLVWTKLLQGWKGLETLSPATKKKRIGIKNISGKEESKEDLL